MEPGATHTDAVFIVEIFPSKHKHMRGAGKYALFSGLAGKRRAIERKTRKEGWNTRALAGGTKTANNDFSTETSIEIEGYRV